MGGGVGGGGWVVVWVVVGGGRCKDDLEVKLDIEPAFAPTLRSVCF